MFVLRELVHGQRRFRERQREKQKELLAAEQPKVSELSPLTSGRSPRVGMLNKSTEWGHERTTNRGSISYRKISPRRKVVSVKPTARISTPM